MDYRFRSCVEAMKTDSFLGWLLAGVLVILCGYMSKPPVRFW